MASMLPTAPWCDRMISAGRTVPPAMARTESLRQGRPSVGITTVKLLAMGLSVIGIRGLFLRFGRGRILPGGLRPAQGCPRNQSDADQVEGVHRRSFWRKRGTGWGRPI